MLFISFYSLISIFYIYIYIVHICVYYIYIRFKNENIQYKYIDKRYAKFTFIINYNLS